MISEKQRPVCSETIPSAAEHGAHFLQTIALLQRAPLQREQATIP